MADIKRKWQIALRRYIIDGRPAVEYAPYFGIDNKGFRKWIELSFTPEMNWGNFGVVWQLDHVVPVSFFDLEIEKDLCLCWNFINIQPSIRLNGDAAFNTSIAADYFERIYLKSGYYLAKEISNKITVGNKKEIPHIEKQVDFLIKNKDYLQQIEGLSTLEMELINKGMGLNEARIEAENIRRLSSI